MIRLVRMSFAALALAALAAACGGSASKTYTDTAESFDQFAQDLVGAVKADKEADFQAIAKDLALPEPKAWFAKTFGDEAGARLLTELEANPARDFTKGWSELRKLIVEQQREKVTTSRHTSPDDDMATGHQANALRAMKQPVALYRIQLTRADGEKSFTLWSFVHEGGKFRFIGKTKQAKPGDPKASMAKEVDMLGELPIKRAREMMKELGGKSDPDEKTASAGTDRTYTDTAASFEQLGKELVGAVKADKKADFEAIAADLRLPDPKAWFTKTFGDEAGARLLAEYEANPARDFAKGWSELRKLVVDQQRDTMKTSRHTSPTDDNATGHQANALRAMKKPVALYRIELARADGEKSFSIWSFVHEGGKFRFIGKTKQAKPADPKAKNARELDLLGELPIKRAKELLKKQK